MTSQRPSIVPPARLAWTLWVLLSAATLPVCQAEGSWLLGSVVVLLSSVGVWLSLRRGRAILSHETALGLVAAAASLGIFLWIEADLIVVLVIADWLMAVGVIKCWQLAGSRDCAHLMVVSMLLLLVGSLVSGQILYAATLLLTVALGPLAVLGWHLLKEEELREGVRLGTPVGQESSETLMRMGRLRGMCVSASLFCLAVGLVIFVAFPRTRTPLRPNIPSSVRGTTGFSAQPRLGEIGRIQRSNRVAMRVRLKLAGQPFGGDATQPYFRAATYSYYDGYGWKNPAKMGVVQVDLPADASLNFYKGIRQADLPGAVEQEYWIDSGSPIVLFALEVPIAVGSQEIPRVYYRPADDVLLTIAGLRPHAAHYKVLSVPAEMLPARKQQRDTPQIISKLSRFWQEMKRGLYERAGLERSGGPNRTLPRKRPKAAPRVYQPRVNLRLRQFAERLASEVGDPSDPNSHEAIVGYFMKYLTSGQFTYTLEGRSLRRGHGALERFLFDTKQGHCEYFATALAVLCQCVGIPARYVTGYHGGKYNQVGQFYAVRDSDAHSWVEVYLPKRGWKRYDPTPPREASPGRSTLQSRVASFIDYLQFQWASWVVAYDILHRQKLLGSFGDWFEPPALGYQRPWMRIVWMSRQVLLGPRRLSALGRILYWLGMVSIVTLSGYLIAQLTRQIARWWLLRQQTLTARRAGVSFYQCLVSALAKRGLMRHPHETPREFALRVERVYPQMHGLFVNLIDRYYAVRFGQYREPEWAEPASRELLRRMRHLHAKNRSS